MQIHIGMLSSTHFIRNSMNWTGFFIFSSYALLIYTQLLVFLICWSNKSTTFALIMAVRVAVNFLLLFFWRSLWGERTETAVLTHLTVFLDSQGSSFLAVLISWEAGLLPLLGTLTLALLKTYITPTHKGSIQEADWIPLSVLVKA